jgi:hypothetical protein
MAVLQAGSADAITGRASIYLVLFPAFPNVPRRSNTN